VIGEICVQYKLPAGDPCWISEKIGSYVGTPLEEAIDNHELLLYNTRIEVKELEELINQYHKYSRHLHVHKMVKAKTDALKREVEEAADIVRSYITPENRDYVKERCGIY
jgi:hypothetical protein